MQIADEGECPDRKRCPHGGARLGDDGIGLIEILVAFTVFMISFLPVLMFLPTGSTVIVNSTNQRYATDIANTVLSNAQSSTIPPAYDPSSQTAPTWSSAASACGAPPAVPVNCSSTSTQGNVTFTIYTLGGWCALDPTTGAWNGTLPAPGQPGYPEQASYHEVVKVAWGQQVSATATNNVVVDATELDSTTGAPVSTISNPNPSVAACPLGLQ